LSDVLIVSAQRTPQGRFLGGLRDASAVDLAVAAGRATLDALDEVEVDSVVVGNVLGAGLGMNVARQVGRGLQLGDRVPAFTVNMMCGSGLQAVALARQSILAGEAEVVLCGGTESMSNAPHLLPRARRGYRLGDATLVDSLLTDGLIDAFDGQHMGQTAERLAQQFGISRPRQDAFALRSQRRHAEAETSGRFAGERIAVGDVVADEHPRADTSESSLASLRTLFDEDGTVTAGNASGINDGAAMLVVASRAAAQRHGWKPLASIAGVAAVGCDPRVMGLGPVHALRKLCASMQRSLSDFDLIELNEAFAAQSLACLQELGLDDDAGHVNPDGGAIAVGHPIGASGARLVNQVAHRVAAGVASRGVAALCVGGGMGVALALDSLSPD
jgi:acetyl-CoA C-acetyltransferase